MKSQSYFSIGLLFLITLVVNGLKTNPSIPKEVATHRVAYEPSFAEFLSHFEKTSLPFAVKLSDLKGAHIKTLAHSKPRKINYRKKNNNAAFGTRFIPELAFGGGFSRMGPPKIEPVARFYPNEDMVAVIYTSLHNFGYGAKSYNLVIYNLQGEIVFPKMEEDHYRLSGYNIGGKWPQKTVTSQIDETGYVWTKTFENQFEKDVKVEDQYKSPVIGFKLSNTEVLNLNSKSDLRAIKEYPSTAHVSID